MSKGVESQQTALLREILAAVHDMAHQQRLHHHEEMLLLHQIVDDLAADTPLTTTFKEITMLPATGGNTLIYTGTINPDGAAFPDGTTFSVSSSDGSVTPSVDFTGLTVTIPLPDGFVDSADAPLTITWATSTFTPSPADSPSSFTVTITPSVPVPPTPTPLGVSFVQTT